MPRTTKNFKWKRVGKPTRCARNSTRTVKLARGKVLLHVCCPAGKWAPRKARCKVGMRAIEKGVAK